MSSPVSEDKEQWNQGRSSRDWMVGLVVGIGLAVTELVLPPEVGGHEGR